MSGGDSALGGGPPVLEQILGQRVVFVLRATDADAALRMGDAIAAAGARALEVTMTVPQAPRVLRMLAAAHPEAIVGAGTVRDGDETARALEAGAAFLVSPGFSDDVLARAREAGVPFLPGVGTATEVMRARAAGCRTVKLFPAEPAGPQLLRALRGPFPDVGFVPTGGIAVQDIERWLSAGAVAVGLGSGLDRAGTSIVEVVANLLALVAEAR